MTYLRGFQLVRIFFQPERIARVFNSGEWGLILASIDFVGTKSVTEAMSLSVDNRFKNINGISMS
mgnify:CR=1 FL=1